MKLGKRGRVRRWYLTCWRKLTLFSRRIFLQGKGWRGSSLLSFPCESQVLLHHCKRCVIHILFHYIHYVSLGKWECSSDFRVAGGSCGLIPQHLIRCLCKQWALSHCLMKCSSQDSEGLLPPDHDTFPPDHSRGSWARAGTRHSHHFQIIHCAQRGLPGLPPPEPKAALPVALLKHCCLPWLTHLDTQQNHVLCCATHLGQYCLANAGDVGSVLVLGRSPSSRKWRLTPVFHPGKSHGQRSLED